ncbi:uncharacterized protein LOC120186894 [Hibiscus syriacus]|uniref:uncharacterized protein LOC120186894 n=1 Tax=Hibiscus syriacus TaxID=106335 RepID=UPI0019225E22|nr:uncharacterized protein LOC120186894 [Hibiscus syriacus]
MKGRTHRAEPHDDWGDGSWTVDCICGVNFDDGEEMVKCDECGVWVHTRCSRYTKGEELFACDKCKNKSNRNYSEETEVAQLLVELPTKTVRIESSSTRRPFRLWTDIPMEERVHVQGVPGGEPGLFRGLSGVFTPQLWKCSGYVPKKFNFQYREFPCWDEKKEDNKTGRLNEIESGNLADNGAGVLFSLSKERVFSAPMYSKKDALNEGKKSEHEDVDGKRWQNGVKTDRGVLQPVMVASGEQQKDENGLSKDRSTTKKVRSSAEKEACEKKRAEQPHTTVFRPSCDAKQLEYYEDRVLKPCTTDVQSGKNKNFKDSVLQEPKSDGNLALNRAVERPKNNASGREHASEVSSSVLSGHNSIRENGKEKADDQFPPAMTGTAKTEDLVQLPLVHKYTGITPAKEEGDSMAINKVDGSPQEHQVDVLASTALRVLGNYIIEDSNRGMSHSFDKPVIEAKRKMNDGDSNVFLIDKRSNPDDTKDTKISFHQIPETETPQMNDRAGGDSHSSHSKAKVYESEIVADCHSDKANELSGDCSLLKHDLEGSEVSESVKKSSSESNHSPRSAEEPKASINVLIPISSIPDDTKPIDTQNNTKQLVMTDNNISKKDHGTNDVPRNEDRLELSHKAAKERTKSSSGSTSKVSHHQSRISNTSILKRTISESKDSAPSSSLKASFVQNSSVTSATGESIGSLQSQSATYIQQNKTSASGLPQKGEKSSQSSTQIASKVTHASSVHPLATSNSSTLSDEELALLLHQELNSSPRVPRVPRVRQTGSFPQLASATAKSMLMKRASSSGGKDCSLVPRRKNKDASKDGFRGSRELDHDAKRTDKVRSSHDQRQDIGSSMDVSAKRNDKNVHPTPATTSNSGPSSSTEANEQNLPFVRSSPRNFSDDDAGTGRGSVPRTLPGLINDIMSKGRRMTYGELCNAVLPHWPNLRKHNGERYAYSSHSQAVLDCLRNRQEWAQLVDRGPKTNSSKKKRKADAEDSDDNEFSKGRSTKELESKCLESQKEDFPKGKRKARKRRRLALQGRGIKDVQRRRKVDFSDDDDGPFSNSSEESMFSEDDIQGRGACPVGSEATTSSDETGSM